jgi:hypothetical protein
MNTPGTLISSTLDTDMLLGAFLRHLFEIDRKSAELFYDAYVKLDYSPAGPFWEELDKFFLDWPEEEKFELLEQAIQTLDLRAPPGHYFGAHPDDASDFGFWPMDLLGE